MTLQGISAVFVRDFRKFLSHPFFIVVMFLIPALLLAICGSSLGGFESHLPIGVVQAGFLDEDTPLFTSAAYYLNHVPQADPDLAYRGKILDVTTYADEKSAKQDLVNGKISAVVVFPPLVTNDNTVDLYIDSSELMESIYIQPAVENTLLHLGAHNPVAIHKIYGNVEYIYYYCTGLLVMTLFTTCMSFGAISLLRDKESGTHEGYLATRLEKLDIILGSIAGNAVRTFLVGLLMFWGIVIISGQSTPPIQQFLSVAFVLIVCSIGIASLLVFLACVLPSQPVFTSVASLLNITLYMCSGAIFPRFGMPDWIVSLYEVNPEHYAVHAVRCTLMRDQGITVYGTDLVVLLLFSMGMILLSIVVYRRTLDKSG